MNKKRTENQFKNLILFTCIFALGFSAQPIFAAAPTGELQNDAQFTCASAIDIMECIQKTNSSATATQPVNVKNMSGSTESLGINSPLSVGARYDNDLGWILDAAYAQAFYSAAVGLKISIGPNEHRANITLGTALTDKQQIKLTYEYLSQNLPFDFVTGTVNEWVSQNAFGAAYRYLFNYKLLHSFDLSGTYIKANSKNLSQIDMGEDELSDVNKRHIAGGEEKTVMGSFTLTPFTNTSLKIGAGYSQIAYNTLYEDNQKNTTLAYTADLSQLLTSTTKITASINNTAASRNHSAKISQILPGSLEASVSGQYAVGAGELADSSSITASLSYPAPKTYSEGSMAKVLGALKDWIKSPVVSSTRVLAIKDEQIAKVIIEKGKDIPNQTVLIGKMLSPIDTKNYFKFDPEIFEKVTYKLDIVANANPGNPVLPDYLALTLNSSADNYGAILSSNANMPISALTPGTYTITLTATGVRKGQPVTSANSSFQLTVAQDSSLPDPEWKTNAQLEGGIATQVYGQRINLKTLLNNAGDEDAYTFEVTGPSWLQLINNGQTLAGNDTIIPMSEESPATITLNAISHASGKSTGIKTFYIPISGNGNTPEWKKTSVDPTPTFFTNVNISLKDAGYVDASGPDSNKTFFFTVVNDQNQAVDFPIPGLSLSNTGFISGNLNNINSIGIYNLRIKATNTAGSTIGPLRIR